MVTCKERLTSILKSNSVANLIRPLKSRVPMNGIGNCTAMKQWGPITCGMCKPKAFGSAPQWGHQEMALKKNTQSGCLLLVYALSQRPLTRGGWGRHHLIFGQIRKPKNV